VPEDVTRKQDGFSLVPLLENPQAEWHEDRMLFTHVGRWDKGADPVKYGKCSVRWKHYLQVREGDKWCLYDLKADPGEKSDLAGEHKDEQAYKTAPSENPFKAQYRKQYGDQGSNTKRK
jgi:arylsulfatase